MSNTLSTPGETGTHTPRTTQAVNTLAGISDFGGMNPHAVNSVESSGPPRVNDPDLTDGSNLSLAPAQGNVDSGNSFTQAVEVSDSSTNAPGVLPEENSGREIDTPHESPARPAALYSPEPADSGLRTPDSGLNSDEWRIHEANRRQQILATFHSLVGTGISRADAAAQTGQGYATIWRWQKRFAAMGFTGLIPETEKCGRKSTFDKLGFTPEQVEAIRKEVGGLNLDLNSTTAALRLFANSDRCPSDLAAVILDPNRCSKHALPPSLRAAAQVTKPQRQAHRGPRALSLGGIWTPRRMDVLPGDVYVADDTTPIWAWWVPWCESEEYPFGVKLLQGQFIPVMDVASQAVITYVIIAREKSSYRAADIWHLFGHTFEHVGLPRLGWQLERGSWEANVVRGQEVSYEDGEITLSRRVGGLRQLPSNVSEDRRASDERLKDFPATLQTWTSYLPKTKTIEAFFNRSQNLEGTLWGCLGRDQMRAPMERAKKQFQACTRKGKTCVDPRLHFLSFTEMCARLNGLLNYVNSEPMEGEIFHGVPRLKFDQAVAERPLFRLPEELAYLYKRDWAVVTITGGWARVRLTHSISGQRYSLFYINPAQFAELEGQQVVVYFDREHFELPAQIILARTGEYLCAAQYEERKGSFLDGDSSGHDVRKQWRNAVMSAYGTLAAHAPSRQLPAEIAARRSDAARANGGAGVLTSQSSTTVDGRPAAAAQPMRGALTAPTANEFARRREQLARQAAQARALTASSDN